MNPESITIPPVPQSRSSQVAVALGAPICAALASIIFTALSYRILPADVAKDLMAQINPMLLLAGGGGSIAGAVGVVQRGLILTKGKVDHEARTAAPAKESDQ